MKDSEIIKALKICSDKSGSCRGCPLYCSNADCINDVKKQAIALINRQQAEIERLEKHELSEAMKFNSNTISNIKVEAIKEFAERLKSVYDEFDKENEIIQYDNLRIAIDDTVKEMAGD